MTAPRSFAFADPSPPRTNAPPPERLNDRQRGSTNALHAALILPRHVVPGAGLASATIVACDSQDAVAPVASVPTAPSLAIGGAKNTLTIYIVDQTGAQVTTGIAQFLVQNTNTGNGFFTLDNNYNDADNTTFGRILITGLVAGT
jgi:hypothetical protein